MNDLNLPRIFVLPVVYVILAGGATLESHWQQKATRE